MTAVLPYTRPPDQPEIPLERRHRWLVLLAEVGQLAHAIANTDFVPRAMRGNEAAIAASILYGDEVGLSPMQALAKIAVIDGKPSLAAEAQRALILAAGHNVWLEEQTITRVTIAGKRHDQDQIGRVTWTMDDAKRAKLADKQNWRQYPRQMLIARASAELARSMFADVIGGLAATEELEDVDQTATGAPEAAEAPAAASRRRRRAPAPIVAPVAAQAPDAPPEPPLPEDAEEPALRPPSEPALRKMFVLFGELGMRDRDTRLQWASEKIGRELESAAQLTDVETSTLIDALQAAIDEAAFRRPANDLGADRRRPVHAPEDHGRVVSATERPLACGCSPRRTRESTCLTARSRAGSSPRSSRRRRRRATPPSALVDARLWVPNGDRLDDPRLDRIQPTARTRPSATPRGFRAEAGRKVTRNPTRMPRARARAQPGAPARPVPVPL